MINRLFLFFLLLIPCLAFSQQTEDLIDNNYDWVNTGIVDTGITCWAPGDPGYCGPLPAIGAFSPDGINFSYGLTDLYQPIDIQMALNAAGTGIIVTGFNFYFTAKNGNGWDDGRTDYLQAYVDFYNSGNQLLESYNYNLNYQFNWTNFNYTETFSDPYRLNQIETAVVGFLGRDNNYWAGFYGPEVYNIGFSLTYGADPCVDDPLSSPSCPNFQEAILELQCASDPLSDTNCPGYLEASLAIEEETIEEEELVEEDEEIIASNEEDDLDDDSLEEEETSDEDIEEEVLEEEIAEEESSDSLSPDLLKIVLSIVDATEENIDTPLPLPALNVDATLSTKDTPVDNKLTISETTQSDNTKEISEELAQSKEEITSVDITENREEELTQEQTILEISDNISDLPNQVLTSDNLVTDKQDTQTLISSDNSQNNFNKESDDISILETLLSSSESAEQEMSTSVVLEEEQTEEVFGEQEIDLVTLLPQLELSNITTSVSSTGFANNNMQQLLAFGGNITEILNTPVPNFTRFEIKPPSQEEQVQTAKVENAAQNMSADGIEAEVQERINSMDPSAQAIALQLMGYKAGFNSYGGTYQDVDFYKSKDLYTGNKVQNDRNTMLNLIGVDNKHQRMIEDQFK